MSEASLHRAAAILAACAALAGCGRGRRAPGDAAASVAADPPRWSEAWLDRERARYLTDAAHRRASLEASLVNHENTYSRQRLAAYGLGEHGWDLLPVWNPRSRPVTREIAAALEGGAPPELPADLPSLWDGRAPATHAGWVALGRRVFFEYPLRAEVFMEWGLTKPSLATAVGVERTADGAAPGLVVFANVDGKTRVGITCAICHTAVRGGALVAGAARRSFDYGRLRLSYFEAHGGAVDPRLAKRMAGWGPGRADVTEDNDEDPVAIPDLWGLRAQTALTAAGTIRHTGPIALALRQETQLLHTNHQRVRPPRELAWALAMFLYSLEPPARTPRRPPEDGRPTQDRFRPRGDPENLARGARLFTTWCKGCHHNEAYGGEPIPVARAGTDAALATGPARGTGRYRPPPLLGIADGAPYLHHGAIASLDELLSPRRLEPDYRGGRFGPGPVPGHRFGTELGDADRGALIAFLETL